MLRKILAWLLNWDLVLLVDYDGNVCVRRVIEIYGRFYAWRYGLGVRKVKLLEGGKVGMCCYVHSWEIVRHKKGSKLQSLLTTNAKRGASKHAK